MTSYYVPWALVNAQKMRHYKDKRQHVPRKVYHFINTQGHDLEDQKERYNELTHNVGFELINFCI